MLKRLVLATVLLQLTCVATAQTRSQTEYRWDHQAGRSLLLSAGERTIWSYHFTADGGFPYVHPAATADGTVLTDLAPADHPWHRGVWFSWKFLDGINYWDWAGRKEGIPEGITKPVGKEVVEIASEGASVQMDLHYVHQGSVVLKERRQIVVGLPRDDGPYAVDWKMTFTAPSRQVLFDRTPPKQKPWGGYGGLSFRAARSMRDHRVIDSEGRVAKAGHGKSARWMDFSAAVDADGSAAGIAIFDHPDNPRHPSPWYVSIGRMGYFGPALLFNEPYTLAAGESFTLKYRLLLHRGLGVPDELEKEYQAYSGKSSSTLCRP